MGKQVSPFTKEQLIPQEETLEIYKNKGQLFIGVPKPRRANSIGILPSAQLYGPMGTPESSHALDLSKKTRPTNVL